MSDPRLPTSIASGQSEATSFATLAQASFTQVIQAESAATSTIEVGSADTLKRTTTSNREGNPAAGSDGLWDGYTGTGYFDPGGQIGDGIRFTVTAPEAGTYRLTVRYANGDANGAARPMALAIDGQSAGVMQFAAIGAGTLAWETWAEEVVEVTLKAGANVLTLVNTTKNGPNLDQMVVTSLASEVNTPPVIVDLPSAITVAEGSLNVADVNATDANAGQTLSYSITGGADAALFAIDAASGVLTFKAAPDFEAPADADGNNVYDVVVGASDGVATTTQGVLVTVSDVFENRAPVFTSPASATAAENQTAALTIAASDPDAGQMISYAIAGGADAALFAIDAATGALSFKAAPDFEAPADADANNVYQVTVGASDGVATTTQDLLVTVADVSEGPPSFTQVIQAESAATSTIEVGSADTLKRTTTSNREGNPAAGSDGLWDGYTGTGYFDPGGQIGDGIRFTVTAPEAGTYRLTVRYANGDANGAARPMALAIDGQSAGVMQFAAIGAGTLAWETWAEEVVEVTLKAGANVLTLVNTTKNGPNLDQMVVTSLASEVNTPPVIVDLPSAITVAEGSLNVADVNATDANAGQTLSYSITGGADAALFAIDAASGVLTFKAAPDFEAPADADGNNVYDVVVGASDGVATTTQGVLVTVSDVFENRAPVFTSPASATAAENQTAALTIAASDPDAGQMISYAIAGGADAALFAIDAATGALSFKAAPDFEAPADADANNVYQVTVGASDGVATTTQDLLVTVADVSEGPPSFTQVIQAESAATSTIEVGSADTLKRTTTSNREGNPAAGSDGLWDGYTGTGYFDPGGQIGDGIRFTVTAPEAGTYRLTVRYANGDANGAARPMALAIDGQSAGVMQFAAIGAGTLAWETWAEEVVEVTLKAGANVLTLVNTTKNGPNLDQMVVTNATAGANSPPTIVDLPSAITVTEGSLMVVDVNAVDADAGQTLTYSIAGGADAGLFAIDPSTGILTFKIAPDFESPADANADNIYDVIVGVSDGVETITRALPVTVADGPDGPFNVLVEAEGARTTIIEVGSRDSLKRTFTENRETNPAAGSDGLWDGFSGRGYFDGGSQVGDGLRFTVSAPGAGEYRMIVRYTNADPAGANRPMVVSVDGQSAGEIAFASTGTTNAGWEAWTETTISLTLKAGDNQITLLNAGPAAPNIDWLAVQSVAVNLPPVFQQLPAQLSVSENGTNVIDVNATDPNSDQTLTYSIAGPDAGRFTINPITGALVFNQAPDFEHPTDAGTNNVYDLTVSVSDGAATTSQSLTVTVTDVAETPPPSSEPGPRQTIRVNFQDGTTPVVAGYLVDNFQGYGDRGNGYQYGWVTEASATDADGTTATPINSGSFPSFAINERTGTPFDGYDARLTGYAHFDLAGYPTRTAWQVSVANGWYEVTASVGDTGGPNDSVYKLMIEGVLVSDYRPTDQYKSQLVTQVVKVTDGFLTLAAPGGTITEIQYFEARPLPDLTPGDGREAPLDYAEFIKPVAVAQEGSQIFSVALDPDSGFASGVDPEADIFLGISVAENRGGVLLASLRDGSFRLIETLTGEPVAITANTTGGADSITITPNVPLKPFTSYTLVVDGAQDRGSTSDLASPPREFQKFTTTFLTGAERVPEAREVGFEDTLLINGATTFSPDFQPLDGGFLYTSLELSPDGKHLYVATLDGQVIRFAINPATGGVNYANREVFAPDGDFNVDGARRGIVGLAFDPEDANVIWITDNQPIPLEGRDAGVPDFSGRISKITLGTDGDLASATIETYVTGLPRSNGDHVSNSLEFRANPDYDAVANPDAPKYLMYLTQGSNSAMGEADSAWGFRPERLLNASVLEIDPTRDAPPGGFDVSTEPLPTDGLNRRFADTDNNLKNGGIAITSGEYQGKYLHFAADGVASVRDGALATSALIKEFYDPFTSDAVVKLFAAGTRNAYDLVWHSNGNLYVPTNGSAAGGNVPNDPSTPANERLNSVGLQSDYLFKVEEGGYYGHPNPLLDNFIMNGGNPTSGVDRNEVPRYVVGTQPDPNYRLADTYSLGNNRSPNGAAEFTSNIFGASLKGGLIFTEYSGGNDLRAVLFDENGRVSDDFVIKRPDGTVIQEYVDPLDVVVNPLTGQIYMLTLDRSTGRSQVVLLDPRPGAEVGDTTADEGGDLAVSAIDVTDPSAAIFAIAGLDADITAVRVSFDGGVTSQAVTLDAQGQFTVDVSALGTGSKTATLVVNDNAGNTAQATVSFTLTPPPADTSADEDGNLSLVALDLSNRAAALFGVTGLDPDIQSITVQIGANAPQAVTLGTDGRFTLDLSSASGQFAVTLQVTDDAANTASAATQLNLPADTSADEDGNLALAAIDLTNRATALFEATGVDPDIQSVTVQVGTNAPQAVTLGTNGRFTLDLSSVTGQFTVTLQVTDEVANTATAATQLDLPADTSADEDGNLALTAIDLSNRAAAVFEAAGIDADIQSITVQIGTNAPQAVTLGTDGRFTLNLGAASGDIPVTLQVTDEVANTASVATQVNLPPAGDAQITVRSLDPSFFDNRLHFNWIQNPAVKDANGQALPDRDYKESGTVRFTNDGTTPLQVLSHEISGPFKLANPTALTNLTLAPGQFIDVKVDFNRTAYKAPTTDGAINNFSGQLKLTTNDPDTPVASVDLAGFYQSVNEGGREPNLNEIWEIFGFGNSIENLSRIKAGEFSTLDFFDLYIAADSTEILNPYFRIADGVTSARITQLAAFHSPSGAPLALHNPANINGAAVNLNHSTNQSQSILPLTGSNFTTATFTNATIPDGWAGDDFFGVKVAGQSTNPLFNPTGAGVVTRSALAQRYPDYTFQAGVNGAEPKVFDPFGMEVTDGYTVRVFEAVDRAGVVIPNTYLLAMDYTGINYDFNDNVLILEGVTPVSMADISLHEVGGTGDGLVMSQDPSTGSPDQAVLRISNDAATGLPTPSNIGTLRIESVTVADPTMFEIVSPANLAGLTLAPGESLNVTVRYIGQTAPTPAMMESALIVRSNDHDEGVLSFDLIALPQRGAFVTGVNYGGGAIASDPVLGVPLKAPTEANGVTMTTNRTPGTDSSANANGANATPGSAFKTYQDAAEWTTTIAVPNGTYIVGVHTQETFWNLPHKRIFDVTVNGDLVADNLDPFVAAGNKGDRPVLIETMVTVTDGKVTILLDALAPDGIDNAAINAVTIHQVTTPMAGMTAATLFEVNNSVDPAIQDSFLLNLAAQVSEPSESPFAFAGLGGFMDASARIMAVAPIEMSLSDLFGDPTMDMPLQHQPELAL